MRCILGIDTSNYTTSVAYITEDGEVKQAKRLLPVEQGKHGLRQSDAVFHHVRQLPELLEELFASTSVTIEAIGVSDKPRSQQGSYMPCFTAGTGFAYSIGAVLHLPVYTVSHQVGHIFAALYSAKVMHFLEESFLAFHVSGGTTEALLVQPDRDELLNVTIVGKTLDLKAGQAIDRVGGMLNLSFPSGSELEKLALQWEGRLNPKVYLRGTDCSLSGVENRCARMKEDGEPAAKIARYCIETILKTLDRQTEVLLNTYEKLPIVFAGGVMSNSIIKSRLSEKYNAYFAEPVFSSDNAAGVALAARYQKENKK